MTNGLYDTSNINTSDKIRSFIDSAIKFSYQVNCQSKYKDDVMHRDIEKNSSVEEYLDDLLSSKDMRLNCVDRFASHGGQIKDCDGEIVMHSTSNPKTGRTYWRLLYCHMSLENLQKLVSAWDLKLKEI